MYSQMTVLSREAFQAATSDFLSIQEAVDYLENDLKTRNLRSILDKFAKGRDLKTLLENGMIANHPETNPESVKKRVRNWRSPKYKGSVTKLEAIEIAYILQLSFEEADELVRLMAGEPLHWRNAKEIVLIYGLVHGLSYERALEINDEMKDFLASPISSGVPVEMKNQDFTYFMQDEILNLRDEDELRDYIMTSMDRIGFVHNQAYECFTQMMDQLQNPINEKEQSLFHYDIANDQEKVRLETEFWDRLSVRDMLKEYFYEESVISAKGKSVKSKKDVKAGKIPKEQQYVLSEIQKNIVKSWPDEVTISKMKKREEDVSRKVLILLYLATEDYSYLLEDMGSEQNPNLTEEEARRAAQNQLFTERLALINDFLCMCSFSQLDPRNPFDWLVIYCLCVEECWDIDKRMEDMFKEMFSISDGEEK